MQIIITIVTFYFKIRLLSKKANRLEYLKINDILQLSREKCNFVLFGFLPNFTYTYILRARKMYERGGVEEKGRKF